MGHILQVLIERGNAFKVEYFQLHFFWGNLNSSPQKHFVKGPFPETSGKTEYLNFSVPFPCHVSPPFLRTDVVENNVQNFLFLSTFKNIIRSILKDVNELVIF